MGDAPSGQPEAGDDKVADATRTEEATRTAEEEESGAAHGREMDRLGAGVKGEGQID